MNNFDFYVSLYRSGVTMESLDEMLRNDNSSFDEFKDELLNKYVESSGRLSETMKMIIAARDESDISRRDISKELGFNSRTIQRACQMFGNVSKYHESKNSFYSLCEETNYDIKLDENGNLICPISMKKCKSVQSEISNNGFYSIDSGEEWHIKDNKLYRVKWEEV